MKKSDKFGRFEDPLQKLGIINYFIYLSERLRFLRFKKYR